MKKLLALFLLLFSSNCYAATISIQPFISGNDVTIAHLENQRSTLQNLVNGLLEGGMQNIKAGSITSSDLATAINPVTFRDEAFNDWTFTGMLPPTSGTLASTITAGTSYVSGVRVVTNATAHTFTASKDTYLYINSGGYFDYVEVANGASAPATPSNELLLAKVVTNGTTVSSVSDLRTTSIQLSVNTSTFPADYRQQALVVRDSSTTMHVEPGSFSIGVSLYSNTADTSTRSTATAANWIEGSVPSQANLKYYLYGYNSSGSAFDFKFASADPVYSDTSSNTGGTLRYYTSGGTTYRALAWVSADSTGAIQTYNFSNWKDGGIRNIVSFETSAVQTGTTALPDDDTIPDITEGNEFMNITIKPTNANHKILVDVVSSISDSASSRCTGALFQNTTAAAIAAANQTGGSTMGPCIIHKIVQPSSTTPITFRFRAGQAAGATTTFNGEGGARKFGGVCNSSITAEEIED